MNAQFLGNSLRHYLVAAGTFAAVYAGLVLLRREVLDRLREWHFVEQLRGPEAPLIAFYLACRQLNLNPLFHRVLIVMLVAALTYRAVRIAQEMAAFAVRRWIAEAEGLGEGAVRNIVYLSNVVIWVCAVLIALSNLGVNVTTIIAGLGIGGVAVALAAQAVLGDLFSAVAIFLDKPFMVGDAIAVDKDWAGTVESIGVKTTRVRAATGEILVFSNSTLTSSRIRNYRAMNQRRASFTFGISRQTPVENISRVKRMIGAIIAKNEKTKLERVHFVAIGEASLDFEVAYHVLSPDHGLYMDINERILLELLEGLRKENVELSVPARVLIQAEAKNNHRS